MQTLALDIAGRSMFSLEMAQFGDRCARLLTEFAERHAQPHLLDMLLPPSIPTRRAISGAARFQRRWMALIDAIMRRAPGQRRQPRRRAICSTCCAPRAIPETGEGFSPRPTARPGGDDDPRRARDDGGDAVLVADSAGRARPTSRSASPPRQRRRAHAGRCACDAMPRLVRTRAVVNETLRLYPPAFTLAREAIGAGPAPAGIDIPRGSVLMIAPWVLHRHRRLWRDPDAFDPSRFLPDAPPPPRFAYLPFGAGPRVCVGAQFALAEAAGAGGAAAAIPGGRVDDRPVLPVAIVTTQPDHPAPVQFTRR